MQLSSLEIKGFKSFGDKVNIHFDAGITGVVGPNGCGKSNIVDAIRWVLGEQKTRALRSDKMENIIFNGTKNRKPLQMAEVMLTFNNTKNILPTAYSQVSITRRYYRSGESEYLLNGVPCRLKDITNLFLDTGIGSDSYAIIELKMVDDLLNDREGSRRSMFEEAAGISKFKLRKKDTFKKLEDTDKDLERVEDVLFEINKNLKQLEKQAKQAEQYFQLKEVYKAASIKLAQFQVLDLYKQEQALEAQKAEANKARGSITAALAQVEASLATLKKELIAKEKLVQTRQKTLNEHTLTIKNYESEKQIKNEKLKNLNTQKRNLEAQLLQDEKHLKSTSKRIEELKYEAELLKEEAKEKESAVASAKLELENARTAHQSLSAESNELQKQQQQLQQKVFQQEKSLEIARMQLSQLKQELEKNQTDASAQSANLQTFANRQAILEKEKEAIAKELAVLVDKEAVQKAKSEENKSKIEELKELISKFNREIDVKQKEYDLTKSLVDNLEGFPEAIRFLKKNADWRHHAPLLSDILTCNDEYRVAIETYLENYMNFFVVENSNQAMEAITLLGKSNKGRANFFILDDIPFQAEQSNVNPPAEAIYALDVIEYEPIYKPLLQLLLKGVYISQTAALTSVSEEVTVLAQSGNLIKRKFQYSGGSVGIFEGKRIGRVKNLEKLQQEIQQLSKQNSGYKNQLAQTQQEEANLKQENFTIAIEAKKKALNLLEQEEISLKVKAEQINQLLSNSSNRKEDILEKANELEAALNAGNPDLDTDKAELSRVQSLLIEQQKTLAHTNEENNKLSTALNLKNVELVRKQNELATKQQEISYRENEQKGLERRIARNLQELATVNTEIEGIDEKSIVSDDELLKMYAEREAITQGMNDAEKEYYAQRNEIDELEKQAKELNQSKDANQTLLNEIELKLNENQLKFAGTRERLQVEFGVALSKDLMENFDASLYTENGLLNEQKTAKDKIERLGTVNPMAMETFNEMKTRADFIEGQKKDLLEAKISLQQTISEIDEVAKQTFLEVFQQIRTNFQKVFRTLFTEEDTCELSLSNPASPLDCDINIIARPKGKRPLTINQLSGGEKTLTAISLLFSIYLIKPAPFCIFDEVDAPLDDANIDKFNKIIRSFSTDSQFIIVTHNKRTMASTDTIYGITMLEAGVSRVIPVDLRELS